MIKHGWAVNDVVQVIKEWCVICARSRYHEVYQGYAICLNEDCRNQLAPRALFSEILEDQPPFQIERFIKEGL